MEAGFQEEVWLEGRDKLTRRWTSVAVGEGAVSVVDRWMVT